VEHIADVYRLNLEINRSLDVPIGASLQEHQPCETVFGIELSLNSKNAKLKINASQSSSIEMLQLRSPIVAMMQTTNSRKRQNLGIIFLLSSRPWVGRVFLQSQMCAVAVIIAHVFR
jgi:hypothetical protein